MTSKKKRSLEHRRDRRKAKASKWKRQGKANMNAKVGHGPSGSPGGPHEVRTPNPMPAPPPAAPRPGLKVRLALFVEDEEDEDQEVDKEGRKD
jgi:hypothetical protein